MRYCLEDVRNKQIEFIDEPGDAILNVSQLVSQIGFTSLLLDEVIAADYFLRKGYCVLRLPLENHLQVNKYLRFMLEQQFNIKKEAVSRGTLKNGHPDFLIYNVEKKIFSFIEVKKDVDSTHDTDCNNLNSNQKKWIQKFDYPLKIFRLLKREV